MYIYKRQPVHYVVLTFISEKIILHRSVLIKPFFLRNFDVCIYETSMLLRCISEFMRSCLNNHISVFVVVQRFKPENKQMLIMWLQISKLIFIATPNKLNSRFINHLKFDDICKHKVQLYYTIFLSLWFFPVYKLVSPSTPLSYFFH